MNRWLRSGLLSTAALLMASGAIVPTSPALAATRTSHASPAVMQQGRWLVDSSGRAIVLHGVNLVNKLAPYQPSGSGFSDDDAAFLAANGFNAVRVGVLWAGVEPTPGHFNDAYLTSVQATVATLARHGIVSLLDFHQDLANERFGGEGWPSWAVNQTQPVIPAGFPFSYFVSPGEMATWDAFWANSPGPDGVGLQTHYIHSWKRVAAYFKNTSSVMGYDLLNEPVPGTNFAPCLLPIGCADFSRKITDFYNRTAAAIRSVDPAHTIWIEPNVLYSYSDAPISLGTVNQPRMGLSFHDYCVFAAELHTTAPCTSIDSSALNIARDYARKHNMPALLSEFGATKDPAPLTELTDLADKDMLSWLEWAYTGKGDITTQDNAATDEGLVYDPAKAPTGSNVNTGNLQLLARAYPQAVAGTPLSWSFDSGTFHFTYSPQRISSTGHFAAGSHTLIATPRIQYPHGYRVLVTGGRVVSPANAPTLVIASTSSTHQIVVTVTRRP